LAQSRGGSQILNEFGCSIPHSVRPAPEQTEETDQQSWRDFFDPYWKFRYCVAVKSGLSDEASRRHKG